MMARRMSKAFSVHALLVLALMLSAAPGRALWAQAPQQAGPGVGEHSTPINAVPEKREQEKDENDQYRHSKAVAKVGSLVGMNAEQAATTFEVLNFLTLAVGARLYCGQDAAQGVSRPQYRYPAAFSGRPDRDRRGQRPAERRGGSPGTAGRRNRRDAGARGG